MDQSIAFRGQIVHPDRIAQGTLLVRGSVIQAIESDRAEVPANCPTIDAGDGYIAPGLIDLHVHGGAGGDFMDGTEAAFRGALRCHARHGTTRMAITTTVARHEQIL